MRYPLQLSRTGRYAEGFVDLPGATRTTDLVIPSEDRLALYLGAKSGAEVELEISDDERAWAVVQLDRAARYGTAVSDLIAKGQLALRPGQILQGARKSAAGMYWRLPLADWEFAALKVPGGTYAVDPAELEARLDAMGIDLPPAGWTAVDTELASVRKTPGWLQ